MSRIGLNINTVRLLGKTFSEKKWNEIDINNVIFDSFCNILANMNEDETNLLLELTENYLWVRNNDYYRLLLDSLTALSVNIKNIDTIYVIALTSPKDRKKSKNKSSNRLAYDCTDFSIQAQIPALANISLHQIHTIGQDLPKPTKMSKSIMLTVDDYIGSGQTALEALDELQSIKNYNKNKIHILSLVAQEQGVNAINNAGYANIHCGVIRKKGITDFYASPEKEKNLLTMQSIETKLSVEDDFKLGKSACESLVSMIRTPNNTFPIFWLEPKNGVKWQPPFPRKK